MSIDGSIPVSAGRLTSSVSARIGKGRRVHAVILDENGARSLCGRAGGWKVGDAPVDCIACLVRLAMAAK